MSERWCDHCQNTGWLDCLCGGDMCVCENNGEYPCPYCDGITEDGDYEEERSDLPGPERGD
jgi:hypothetical protein